MCKEVKLDSGSKGGKGYYANIVRELVLTEDVAGFREMFRSLVLTIFVVFSS